jgi:hypothetical protein
MTDSASLKTSMGGTRHGADRLGTDQGIACAELTNGAKANIRTNQHEDDPVIIGSSTNGFVTCRMRPATRCHRGAAAHIGMSIQQTGIISSAADSMFSTAMRAPSSRPWRRVPPVEI